MTASCDLHVLNEGGGAMADPVQPEPKKINRPGFKSGEFEPHPSGLKFSKKGRGAPPPPTNPTGKAHWNTGRTFKRDWRGGWGPIADPRSKLSKLVLRIESTELVPVYGRADDVGVRALMRETAQWKALARMTLSRIGVDKEATVRKASGMSRMASSKEAELSRLVGRVKEWRPTSGAELAALAAAERTKAQNHTERRT